MASNSERATDFQLRLSSLEGLVDFTEHKLLSLIRKANDHRRAALVALLTDYVNGNVAVSWRSGEPSYVKIIR